MISLTTHICLLDTPTLVDSSGERRLQLRYRKALGILSYLAAERNRNHSRAFIASLFWPDFDEPSARINLRQALSALTKLFATTACGDALVVNRDFISLQDHPQLDFDIAELEKPTNLESLLREESLLTGVFMAGYSLPDCDEFESWLEDKRGYYRNCQVRLLTQLLTQAQTKHQSERVIDYTRKLLKIDPDNESLLCEAMRLCADYGQPQLSLKLYEHFSQRMERDLGVSPNATSQALYQQILQLSQEAVSIPSHANQFPAVEKISPVVVVHLQWRCHLTDPEAVAQTLYDADHYSRKVLCSDIEAFHLSSAGRGAFFYFGWPKALDDNAWIAVRGVLRLIHYANAHPDVELRAGIHTGLLLSSIKASIPDLLGDVTEETSLLCQSASDGQALMSEACYQLVQSRVQAHKLIEHRRRNDGNLLASYLLVDVQGWVNHDEIFYYPEILYLHQALDAGYQKALKTESPLLTFVLAPAGSGKTTQINSWLVKKLASYRLIKLSCYPDRQQYAFFPIIGCLRQLLGLQADQVISQDALEEHFLRSGWSGMSDLSILIDLLASHSPPSRPKVELIFDAISSLLHKLNDHCLIIWIEDGHWIDDVTFYFLEQLPSRLRKSVFLIMSARQLPYSGQSNLWRSLSLQKPGMISATQLCRYFHPPQQDPLPLDTLDRLLDLSDANPFILKSLTQAYQNRDIPLSIQHYFSFSIDQMGNLRDQALKQSLQRSTQKSDKIKPISPLLSLTLASLTPPTQLSHLHRSIALELIKKRKSSSTEESKQADLAFHWHECNEPEKASDCYLYCANHALRERQYANASYYFQKMLELNTLMHAPLEEQIHRVNDIAMSRLLAYGYNDREAFKLSTEAVKLCQKTTDSDLVFRARLLHFITAHTANDASLKLQHANLLFQLAHTPTKQSIAHWALSLGYLLNQEYTKSRFHAKKSLKLSTGKPTIDTSVYFHENISVSCYSLISFSYYMDGHSDTALEFANKLHKLNAHSQQGELSNLDRCRSLLISALMFGRCGDRKKAHTALYEGLELAYNLKHPLWISVGKLIQEQLNFDADSRVTPEELEWILGNIESSFADAFQLALLLTLDILLKTGRQKDAKKIFKAKIMETNINKNLYQPHTLDTFFKQI